MSVTTVYGTNAATKKAMFTYGGPTITQLSPSTHPKWGAVTVTGTGFGLGGAKTLFKFVKALGTPVNCTATPLGRERWT